MVRALIGAFLVSIILIGGIEASGDVNILNKDTVIFDLRPLDKFKAERIKDSIHIDYDFFEPQLISKNYGDFISFLKITGVFNGKKIFFLTGEKEYIRRAAFLGFFLNLMGVKEVLFTGSFEDLKKRGVPTQTVGKKLELSRLTPNPLLDEKRFFEDPKATLLRGKDILIFECEKRGDFKIKKAKPLSADDFFEEGELITPPHDVNGKKIYLYPEDSKETYIVAFLLLNHLKLDNVKILKGDEKQWKKLNLLEKR